MTPIHLLKTRHSKWIEVARQLTPPVVWSALYRWLVVRDIPDADRYAPHFSPWRTPAFRALYAVVDDRTLVREEACWTLLALLHQALAIDGDVYEAGTYRGGTAKLIAGALADEGKGRRLRLFDSFEGMKVVDRARDRFHEGALSDTSLDDVRAFVGRDPWISYHPGWVPATFAGREGDRLCFAHIDLDLYRPILDACAFVYPRLGRGGILLFDDYGFASTPGARQAIDEFFADKPEKPIALQTAQAFVMKL
jgi:hypothetical protein